MKPLITSLQNPTVKNLLKLRQRRERDRQQRLLIDGARAVRLAVRNAFPVETLYIAEPVIEVHADLLRQVQTASTVVQPVSAPVFCKIGYGEHPDGLLGVAPQPSVDLSRLPQARPPLYLVAEGLEKPGNLGAILRSADAAGVTGVIFCDLRTDLWNPNVVRASQGACFTVPLAVAPAEMTRHWLRHNAIDIFAATPTACRLYTEASLQGPSALVVGAEHVGLTAIWEAETGLRIPMMGQMDSLNVAQTASILLYEAVRQRRMP